MTQKKTKTKYPTDESKHTHREAIKGHKTKRHYLRAIEDEEADEDIRDYEGNNRRQ